MPFDRPSHPTEPDKPREGSEPERARLDVGVNRLLNRTDEERQSDWDAHANEVRDYRAANPRRTLERSSIAETAPPRDERRTDAESDHRPAQDDKARDDGSRASEMVDDNGLTQAEYIAAWNKKAAAEQSRRDPVMRDANGMTAAELRFQRNKQIEEAEAARKAEPPAEPAEPLQEVTESPKPRQVVPDGDRPESGTIELGGPRSKYDASFTEEQRQERIAELMPNAEKAFGATSWANKFRAGTVYQDFKREDVGARYPDGVPYSYEACPQFEQYAIKTVRFKDGFSGNYKADFDEANRLAGFETQPTGTTWHHCEDGYTMHLLDKELHAAARHWGGVRIVKERSIDADED